VAEGRRVVKRAMESGVPKAKNPRLYAAEEIQLITLMVSEEGEPMVDVNTPKWRFHTHQLAMQRRAMNAALMEVARKRLRRLRVKATKAATETRSQIATANASVPSKRN
jgi:hypothetical protein